jgi:DNA-binding CsgD family transcriptional regulator
MRHNGPPGKGELPQIDPAAIEVRDRLSRRARERSAAQRWNGYTLILTYAILATITIMAVESVGTLQLAGVAILGLALIWGFGRFQAGRTEAQSLRDELRAYAEQLSGQAADRTAGMTGPVEGPAAASPLTGRETQVLGLVAAGKSNKETARLLHISDQTVKNHLSHIFVKLKVNDRTSAALLAINHRWVALADPAVPSSVRNSVRDSVLDKSD